MWVEGPLGRERCVALGEGKHLLGGGDTGVRDVVVKMHNRLGLPGRARAVEPEGHVVAARWGWIDLFFDRDLPGAKELWRRGRALDGCLQLLLPSAVDDDDAGARVLDVVA